MRELSITMSGPAVTVELSGLQTEKRNARSTDIDQVSTLELCRIFNREDKTVPTAVESCIAIIAEVIDALTERVRQGGRVFYIGAGTSGRYGTYIVLGEGRAACVDMPHCLGSES